MVNNKKIKVGDEVIVTDSRDRDQWYGTVVNSSQVTPGQKLVNITDTLSAVFVRYKEKDKDFFGFSFDLEKDQAGFHHINSMSEHMKVYVPKLGEDNAVKRDSMQKLPAAERRVDVRRRGKVAGPQSDSVPGNNAGTRRKKGRYKNRKRNK